LSQLQSQCWAPEELAAKQGERVTHRLSGEPDTRPVMFSLRPSEPTPSVLSGSMRRVDIADGRKLVALTFDLCEYRGEVAGYDGEIVDMLRQLGAKATLFAGGKWLLDHKDRAQQLMSDPLFELGNHGWSHANVRRITPDKVGEEIRNTQAAFEAVRFDFSRRACVKQQPQAFSSIPRRLELYRFPYGACNPEALQSVADQGLLAVQWDISLADPDAEESADMMLQTVLRRVRPGSIIIGHANGRGVHTREALPRIIAELRKRGYEFVTVSELMAAGEPVITQDCYDQKPGDVNRYDRPRSKPRDSSAGGVDGIAADAPTATSSDLGGEKPKPRRRPAKPAGGGVPALFPDWIVNG
jgi:peptidoglycan/xylan/chitin deacetylase (PgdA/CDA1 family)